MLLPPCTWIILWQSSLRGCRWVSHSFETSAFRVQIVDGRLWVTHFPWVKYPDGVVPAGLTPWDKTNWCAATPATLHAGTRGRGGLGLSASRSSGHDGREGLLAP